MVCWWEGRGRSQSVLKNKMREKIAVNWIHWAFCVVVYLNLASVCVSVFSVDLTFFALFYPFFVFFITHSEWWWRTTNLLLFSARAERGRHFEILWVFYWFLLLTGYEYFLIAITVDIFGFFVLLSLSLRLRLLLLNGYYSMERKEKELLKHWLKWCTKNWTEHWYDSCGLFNWEWTFFQTI